MELLRLTLETTGKNCHLLDLQAKHVTGARI
jgi:hypothetical protein